MARRFSRWISKKIPWMHSSPDYPEGVDLDREMNQRELSEELLRLQMAQEKKSRRSRPATSGDRFTSPYRRPSDQEAHDTRGTSEKMVGPTPEIHTSYYSQPSKTSKGKLKLKRSKVQTNCAQTQLDLLSSPNFNLTQRNELILLHNQVKAAQDKLEQKVLFILNNQHATPHIEDLGHGNTSGDKCYTDVYYEQGIDEPIYPTETEFEESDHENEENHPPHPEPRSLKADKGNKEVNAKPKVAKAEHTLKDLTRKEVQAAKSHTCVDQIYMDYEYTPVYNFEEHKEEIAKLTKDGRCVHILISY